MKNRTTHEPLTNAIDIAITNDHSPRWRCASSKVRMVRPYSASTVKMYGLAEWFACASWESLAIVSSHQVQKREQEDPDQVDQVPVQAAEVERVIVRFVVV